MAELAERKERERKAVGYCLSLLEGAVSADHLMQAVSSLTRPSASLPSARIPLLQPQPD